jgi:hypothetical protein
MDLEKEEHDSVEMDGGSALMTPYKEKELNPDPVTM